MPGLFPLPTELSFSGVPLFNLRPRKDRNWRLSSRRPAQPGPNAARPSRTQYRSQCLRIPLIHLRLVRRLSPSSYLRIFSTTGFFSHGSGYACLRTGLKELQDYDDQDDDNQNPDNSLRHASPPPSLLLAIGRAEDRDGYTPILARTSCAPQSTPDSARARLVGPSPLAEHLKIASKPPLLQTRVKNRGVSILFRPLRAPNRRTNSKKEVGALSESRPEVKEEGRPAP